MNTIGSRIKTKRKERKLTQSYVGKVVGVSQVSVTQWEQDTNSPRGENLISLAKVLECTPDWLLNGKEVTTKGFFFEIDDSDEQQFKKELEDEFTQDAKKTNTPINTQTFNQKKSTPKYVELDFYDVEVSAGHGALIIQEEKDDSICFSNKFITKELGLKPKNIFLMPVKGDSMVPTLKNQALVMVNQISEFSGDGIYVFRFDGQLMVKRLQFTKRGLNVVSDNATTYPSWELSRAELKNEDFEIIGEVVWSGQRM